MLKKLKIFTFILVFIFVVQNISTLQCFASEQSTELISEQANSKQTNTQQTNEQASDQIDKQAPTKPMNLHFTTENKSLTLAWDSSTDNIALNGYKIYKDGQKYGTTDKNNYVENISDTGFHEYAVRAFDSSGNLSKESNTILIDFSNPSNSTNINDKSSPSIPQNLTYKINGNSVNLSWSESTDDKGIAGYEIYKNNSKVFFTGKTNYIDKKVFADNKYSYSIKACDKSGNTSEFGQTINVKMNSYKSNVTIDTNRFIITYKTNSGRNNLVSYLNNDLKSSNKIITKNNKAIDVIELNSKVNAEEFVSKMKNKSKEKDSDLDYNSDIEAIQPDYEIKVSSLDPLYNKQWSICNSSVQAATNSAIGLQNTDANTNNQDNQANNDQSNTKSNKSTVNNKNTDSYQADINIKDAWEMTKGKGTIIAVLDTGIDITHEDLKDNIWSNPGEILDNNIDDDGNGYIDDVYGWNFIENSNLVHDDSNSKDEIHGTMVSGIIAAKDNNNVGITGLAPDAQILPLKVFHNGTAYTSDIISAINYAEIMGAKVVNCSWGSADYNPALKEAIENSNMLFVCAAGNKHMDIGTTPIYPASYDSNNVISVASINENGILSDFSNYNENKVDIAAPGENILSTTPGNNYLSESGTSMAAAFVAGEASLILNINKDFNALSIKDLIIASSDKLSSLIGKVLYGNKINISNAINNITLTDVIQVNTNDKNNFSLIDNQINNEITLMSESGYCDLNTLKNSSITINENSLTIGSLMICDNYTFVVTSYATFDMSMEAQFDSIGVLYNEDGQVIAQNDDDYNYYDDNDNFNFHIQIKLKPGRYYLSVTKYDEPSDEDHYSYPEPYRLMLIKTDNIKTIEYIYDSNNRLIQIKESGVIKVILSYDNNGNLSSVKSVK